MRRVLFILGLVGLVCLAPRFARAQSAKAWADSTAFIVGDPITVHVEIQLPEKAIIQPLAGDTLGVFSILSRTGFEKQSATQSLSSLVVAAYDSGTAVLPPLVTADFFAGRTYGKIFGVIFVFTGIGGALGAWLAGFVYDHMRSYVPFLIFAIACAILACLAVWIAAPRKVRAVPGKRME